MYAFFVSIDTITIRTKTIKNMYNKVKSFMKNKKTKIHVDIDISIKQNPFLQSKI
jgi:hypothetical protein